MARRVWRGLLAGLLIAVGAGVLAPATAWANVACGQAVNASMTLTHDLTCSGTALFVTAPGVVLNLGGHTIAGPAPSGGNSFFRGVSTNSANVTIANGTIVGFDRGVHLGTGSSGSQLSGVTLDGNGLGVGSDLATAELTITGNTIRNTVFFSGIQLGGSRHHVEGNTLTNTAATGVLYSGNDNVFSGNRITDAGGSAFATSNFGGNNPGPFLRNQIVNNVIAGSGRAFNGPSVSVGNSNGTLVKGNSITGRLATPGVFVGGSTDTTIDSNVLSRNSNGTNVGNASSGTRISGNRASDNRFAGLFVDSTTSGTSVVGNFAYRNQGNGIDVQSPSTTITDNSAYQNGLLGIRAVSGVTDGGGNHAFGNGNPAQCSPTISC